MPLVFSFKKRQVDSFIDSINCTIHYLKGFFKYVFIVVDLKAENRNSETKVLWDRVRVNSTVVEEVKTYNNHLTYKLLKRGFDIISSLFGVVILFLPVSFLCIVIMMDSPGSPVYSQTRLGKDEKPFTMYKLRTMRIDAESDGARWAEDDDPRVTKVGRMLRNTRLDELPQLLNILMGQMSFVGPRPERPEFYDFFDTYIKGYRQHRNATQVQ